MEDYLDRVEASLKSMPETTCKRVGLQVDRFADGEIEVSVLDTIRGKDIYLIAGSARNCLDLAVETCSYELCHTLDALKRAHAATITVVEPYVSASRSDRATKRNSVGTWIHFKLLSSLGADGLICFQLHSDKTKTLADPSAFSIDDIPLSPLISKRLCDSAIPDLGHLEGTVRRDWVFCAVDAGGEKIAKTFSRAFGVPLVVAFKQRDYTKVNTVSSIRILSSAPLKGKTVWIIDDMVDTASSVVELVKVLAPMGPAEINIAVAHPVLSGLAVERLGDLLDRGLVRRFVCTDTIPCLESVKDAFKELEIVSTHLECAQLIATHASGGSFSAFFEDFDAEAYLRSRSS